MRETLRFSGKILSATISRTADQWFASITVDIDHASATLSNHHLPPAENQGTVGVDLGVSALATLSTGETVAGAKPHKALLSRAISDMGFFEFRRQLEYKAAMRGGIVVIADRFFASSKTCSTSGCGHKVDKLPLSVREWVCPACGANHDRDVNAAINLANYASAAFSSHAVSSTVSACGGEGSGLTRKRQVKPAPMKQEFNRKLD